MVGNEDTSKTGCGSEEATGPGAGLGPMFFDHTRHEILLATALFHPPKA